MQAPKILGGRYELGSVLGRGGMAEVRDGWDTRLERAIAVKQLHPAYSSEPDNRRRFDMEARAAAGLNHPHIVAVHDSGEEDGTPFIVMERLPGPTLADAIARGPMPADRVRATLDQVLSALDAAHATGILHRDIKPGNILFTESGDAKVADFGIAKSPGTTSTQAGQVFGTMAYLSPERIAGRPATASDDLYAVGVMAYEALAGRRPYPQENMVELAAAIAAGRPVPLGALRPDVDPGLIATIERAMARDPGWRFGSAREMRSALWQQPPLPVRPPTRVLAEPLPPSTTMAVPVSVPASPRRGKALLGLAAAALAVLLAVVVLAAQPGTQPSVPADPVGTSAPVPPPAPVSTSVPPPSFSAPPLQVEEMKPPKGRNDNGNGNNGRGNGRGNGKPDKGDG